MFTKMFWQLTGERAIKSFAQSLAAVLSAAGLGLLDVEWPTALSTAGMVALLSVLTSVASSKVGPDGNPSVIQAPAPDAASGSQSPSTSLATAR